MCEIDILSRKVYYVIRMSAQNMTRKCFVKALVTIFTLFYFIIFSVPSLKAEDLSQKTWLFFFKDTYSTRYFNPEVIADRSSGKTAIWTRTVPSAKGNSQINGVETLWEIDCQKRSFRNVRTIVIYKNGETLKEDAPHNWSDIEPGIWIEYLYNICCEK